MHSKLQSIGLWNLAFLCLFSCAPLLGASPDKSVSEMWKKTIEKADSAANEVSQFRRTHKLEGQIARAAMLELTNEGFDCNLEYRDLPFYEKGSIAHFYLKRTPLIYCVRPQPKDICVQFVASLTIDWRDASVPSAEIIDQLDTSAVSEASYFCRSQEGRAQ